ncbi:MAG TPA: hypothetical protein VFE40_16220 [Jatrophihabitantaceae bacterium]|jgi:3-oxoacyl-[acyl-carrier protein] reductase|nr:hypothetical protein [Jatrophihabitantaceae bacterium]
MTARASRRRCPDEARASWPDSRADSPAPSASTALTGKPLPRSGRIGTAADVADAVGYLVHAGWVTGTILPVDGGFTVA